MAKNAAICGKDRTASRQVRQISFREQALPWRHHRRRSIRDYYWCVHDVAHTHHFLSPRSVSVQRYDLGDDVCAARPGRRGPDRVNHGARLLRTAPGETPDYEI